MYIIVIVIYITIVSHRRSHPSSFAPMLPSRAMPRLALNALVGQMRCARSAHQGRRLAMRDRDPVIVDPFVSW